MGNGRIEADDIDITTKFAARVTELLVDEGSMVRAGQVLARLDSKALEASLRKAEAQIRQAEKSLDSARADLEQQRSQMRLAEQELERTRFLARKDFASKELLDQRQAQSDRALAAFNAAQARIGEAEHALEAARQEADVIRVNIADHILVAPKDGRIQYRLANVGEVLPAGGKVFTVLDLSNVYMTVFLPTEEAGRIAIGAEGRIVVDAYPDLVIPASVSFVATKSQFTPKTVETRSERDKLMFRVKVRVDPELVARRISEARTGLPGSAYIRTDSRVEWPRRLQVNIPS